MARAANAAKRNAEAAEKAEVPAAGADSDRGTSDDPGPKLTDLEKQGVELLDGFAEINATEGDDFERGFAINDGKVTTFLGSDERPDGDSKHVNIRHGLSTELIGHNHTTGTEGVSIGDGIGFQLGSFGTPGTQMLVRTPSGAIRSVKNTKGGVVSETLRGAPISGFPQRGN